MITETAARHIAGYWHGGQWSALYAFCSSGTIVPGLEREIDECLAEVTNVHGRSELLELKEYVAITAFGEGDSTCTRCGHTEAEHPWLADYASRGCLEFQSDRVAEERDPYYRMAQERARAEFIAMTHPRKQR